jgi:hypothetical protein
MSNKPTSIEIKPTKRNWPSFMATIRLNVSRHTFGVINGNNPSKTSIKPSAVIKLVLKLSLFKCQFFKKLFAARAAHVFKEIRAWI